MRVACSFVLLTLLVFLSGLQSASQSKPDPKEQQPAQKPEAAPQPGSIPEAKPAGPCVILKRMGPADEITSHLYSFGIRGKQFQYVEGNLPEGVSFHGRLTDHDARKILDKGGKIQILEPKYASTDLDAARRACLGLPSVTAETTKDVPKQNDKAPAGTLSTPDHSSEAGLATISVSSNPDGADIYADDAFVGNAPATLKLSVGKHTIKVTMAGFKDWSREITALAGLEAHLSAALDKKE